MMQEGEFGVFSTGQFPYFAPVHFYIFVLKNRERQAIRAGANLLMQPEADERPKLCLFPLRRGCSMHDTQIDQISQIVNTAFAELGVNPPFIETILLHDRRYVGRKFKAGGFQLIWWVEENVMEVFDQDGQVLHTIDIEHKNKKSA
jgi:hypothetical protein